MSTQSAARQYAYALFDVARKTQIVGDAGRDLSALAGLIQAHPELKAVLETPMVVPRKKRALMDALLASADGHVRPEVRRLIELLADRDRLMLIPDIASAYAARQNEADKVITADVTTAAPLDDASRVALAQALGKATGRTVSFEERVDPSILGGVVARVGSLVFDASVVRQIERMRQRLLSEV